MSHRIPGRMLVGVVAAMCVMSPGPCPGLADASARTSRAPTWATQMRPVMGTLWTIEVHAPDADHLLDAAFAEVRRLDGLLSTYRADSEWSRVNLEAGKHWTAVSDESRALLERAFRVSRASGGAFDPTVGALVSVWGFKHGDHRIPDEATLAAARTRVGWQAVELDPGKGIRFTKPGLQLDPGAFAKGYAVDRALEVLRRMGADAARVDAGGNQGVIGRSPTGGPWPFGVRHPRQEGEILGVVPLESGGISTSGDYERGFWRDGVRYGHIVDPRSGRPVRDVLAVTVVAPDAETADALSTALFVLGFEQGERMLEGFPGCHALFVKAGQGPGTFTWTASRGFRWMSDSRSRAS